MWSSSIFHQPGGWDGRDRDIFPLPYLQEETPRPSKVCRAVSRRVRANAHRTMRVNMAIHALNSLFFVKVKKFPVRVTRTLDGLPLCQREAMKGIVQRVNAFGKPPPGACCQGALNALRAPASGYVNPKAGVGDVVGMKLLALSLPSGTIAGVDLAGVLRGRLREMVSDYESWLLQDAGAWAALADVATQVRPYNDPSLHNRGAYLEFLGHLRKCGVLGHTSSCRGRVGAFTVAKRPKLVDNRVVERQRLVLDCRQVNLQFRPPPLTELGSLASLTELELEGGQTLYTAGADIQDCFYACNLPAGMGQFFCLLHDLSPEEGVEVFGGSIDEFREMDRISPCITVLPMGFNWSFYLVQQLHEQACLDSLEVERSSLVLDGYPCPSPSGGRTLAMPYCDNVHSISTDKAACTEGKNRTCNQLSDMGFSLHEEEDASANFSTLGGVIDGEIGEIRTTSARAWNLILAFDYLQSQVVSTELVQRLLGHAMVICVLNRCGMSIFRRLYDFVQAGGEPRRLSKSEKEECVIFIGIIPLLVGDLRR